jgi:hypothetical protein
MKIPAQHNPCSPLQCEYALNDNDTKIRYIVLCYAML